MLTGMTEHDWTLVLEVFAAVRSGRGEPGHDDRKFLFYSPQRHLARLIRRVRQLEQRLEAVLATEPHRVVPGVFRRTGGMQPNRQVGADVRQHRGAHACLGGGCIRGQHIQARGRSPGKFS